jgi:histidinol-phosphatase
MDAEAVAIYGGNSVQNQRLPRVRFAMSATSPASNHREGDLMLAHKLADEARRVSMSWFRSVLNERKKHDGSIVTEADEAVEDALTALLADERPGDAVLGEERGQRGTGERRWIIDGIDGTLTFVRGGHQWGTLIALEVAGEVVLGVAEQPVLRRRYWAARGSGAYVISDRAGSSAERLRVSQVDQIGQARTCLPLPEWQPDGRSALVAERLAATCRHTAPEDHPALQVAWGGSEVAVVYQARSWDLAALTVIVEEAGGRFSDLDGGLRLDSGCGLFTNGIVSWVGPKGREYEHGPGVVMEDPAFELTAPPKNEALQDRLHA